MRNRSVSLIIFLLSLILLASQAFAHSGGTDRYGCHAGSRPYHCHTPKIRPKPRPVPKTRPKPRPKPRPSPSTNDNKNDNKGDNKILTMVGLVGLVGSVGLISFLSEETAVEFNLNGRSQGYSKQEKLWHNVALSTFVYPKKTSLFALGLRYVIGQYDHYHLDIGARLDRIDQPIFGNLFIKIYEDWGLIGDVAETLIGKMSTVRIESDVGVKVLRYKQAYLSPGGGVGFFRISFKRKRIANHLARTEETVTDTTNNLTYSLNIGVGIYLSK